MLGRAGGEQVAAIDQPTQAVLLDSQRKSHLPVRPVQQQLGGASHIGMCTSDVIAAITASDAGGEPAPVLRAVMEYSMPPHASGKFAWFGIGFASGLLNGLLAAQGIPCQRVAGEVHQFW